MASERTQKVYGSPSQSELRIVLLGRIGSGKTTVAKFILGIENLRSEGGICLKKQGEVAGRRVIIVDTPGWHTVKHTSPQIKHEIKNSVTLCPPGPHVLLLVVPMGEQFSSADRKAIQYHIELLSVRAWKYTMVLFVSEAEEKCTNIEQDQTFERAKTILSKCGERHHYFEFGYSTAQISELLNKIDAMAGENEDEFLIPQVYYELLESKMPRDMTELRRMFEDREANLKQRNKRELKEMEEELKKYREAEKVQEHLKRVDSSKLLPPNMSIERPYESGTKAVENDQKVDLQAVKQGYREEALSVVQHYVKPLVMIMMAVVGSLIGSVAGAQYGTLGSCIGMVVGVVVAILGCYFLRGAATAARDIPITIQAKGQASLSGEEQGIHFFIDSPTGFNKDK
ncbi:hypothetical protein UPYG_G00065060 [Umbra pygmaea]|uniref:AIG1-type G domain-containing protein n=1 Tax=Umbra pygmaea TaxID=75934 RepID=A0ABD0XUZ4_UMBPY